MGTFRIITRAELRMRKRMNQEDVEVFDQFKSYLSRMNGDEAGIYEFSKDEDHQRCKKLLRKAARAAGIAIRIVEEEDSLVFYKRIPRGEKKK